MSHALPESLPAAGAGRRAAWGLAGLALSMLLSSLGTSSANVGLPTLARALDAPFSQVQWVVLAYLLAITSCVVGAGRLGDMAGRRRLLLAGIAVFTLASAACGLAATLGQLVAARVAQGMGAAVMMALTMAFVGDLLPKDRAGSAMGLLGTMSAVGTALGPTLGGALIAGPGWRAIFLVNLPLGLAAMGLAYRHLPADRPRGGPPTRFDLRGTLLLAAVLAAYALAMTLGRGRFGVLNAALLLGALAGGGLFLWVEARTPAPLLRPALLRGPGLRAGLAANALVSTVMMATLVVGPFYLTQALGLGAAAAGLVMSAGPGVGAGAGRGGGRAGAPGRRLGRLGGAGARRGGVWLAAGTAAFGAAGYIVPIALLTAGYASFQAANNTAVMASIGAEQRGLVAGMLNLSRNLGLVTGASVMGAVFALGAGAADLAAAPAAAVGRGMAVAFGEPALLGAGAWVVAWRGRGG
ncbi:MFS transporter [Achromobacter ruhlandii]|uniref:MFS transporter n=1 Tax=Achromobacter ruhlandii TaxID=72557 RepID=UPI0007BFBF98|nr:MFS transporter [Achromobacter ruhlandii]